MRFEWHIGIDYSGAATPRSRQTGLAVYAARDGQEPERVVTPASPGQRHWNWSRAEIATWLIKLAEADRHFIAGIDHAFSMPIGYFSRYGLGTWDQFIEDFVEHWPTHEPDTYVDFIRQREPPRTGRSSEYRITETWTSSARSVFHFDAQGQVAKSTHAGIPWLRQIRRAVGERVHMWPFDGWDLPVDKAVVCEVFPSILRRRYPAEGRSVHAQDAYCVARWLRDLDERGCLGHYANPPLTEEERRMASLEGWIFGIA